MAQSRKKKQPYAIIYEDSRLGKTVNLGTVYSHESGMNRVKAYRKKKGYDLFWLLKDWSVS